MSNRFINVNLGGVFTCLFFYFLGFVAVFYAIKSFNCERDGHYEQAVIHAKRSFSWSMATFVIALFIYLALGLIIFIRNIDHH